ncbi:MAG: hypothetical protein JXA93_22860 [Anaerolineae bacterium]|nr:hypothetical protein [Anaerolineae bacterium]
MGVALHLAGGALFALGFALFVWSMVANAHFATVVRVGEEGKHRVCDRGPYCRVEGWKVDQPSSLPFLTRP